MFETCFPQDVRHNLVTVQLAELLHNLWNLIQNQKAQQAALTDFGTVSPQNGACKIRVLYLSVALYTPMGYIPYSHIITQSETNVKQ